VKNVTSALNRRHP